MKHTQSQNEAIYSTHCDILVIAGAGSGKTGTVVARIVHLLTSGVHADQIVAITFTNDAAAEISRRVKEQIGSPEEFTFGYIGTIHGLLLRILNNHGHLVGFTAGAKINVLEELAATELLEEVAIEQKYTGSLDGVRAILSGKDSSPSGSKRLSKPDLVAAEYTRRMRQMNMLDFDAILLFGRDLLRRLPIASLTCGTRPLTHVFLDEAQDCGPVDWEAVRALPIGNRYTVADTDQAIYGFRGGDVRFVVNHAKKPTTQVILLEDNFRCGPAICGIAQELIQHNSLRIPKSTVSATEWGAETRVEEHDTPEDEVLGIVTQIRERKLLDGTVAVLCRSNALVAFYTNAIRSYGFSNASRETVPMPTGWVACKLALQLLASPTNDFIAERWLRASLGKERARQISYNAAAEMQSVNKHFLHLPPVELSAVPTHLAQTLRVDPDSVDRVIRCIATLPRDSSINDLLLALREEQFRGVETGKGITITTIHSAKGREWDAVFLPALEDEIIPGHRKHCDVEEERRLAYVAITRAKKFLMMSHAASRIPPWGPQKPLPHKPSRFIRECFPF